MITKLEDEIKELKNNFNSYTNARYILKSRCNEIAQRFANDAYELLKGIYNIKNEEYELYAVGYYLDIWNDRVAMTFNLVYVMCSPATRAQKEKLNKFKDDVKRGVTTTCCHVNVGDTIVVFQDNYNIKYFDNLNYTLKVDYKKIRDIDE